MKNILIILSFALTFNSFGQELNNYSYVVVPEKFSFLKEADQYQLNSLTRFLFEKYDFEAYLKGEGDYKNLDADRCEGLYADVLDDSGMFRTKLRVVLKDCQNREVFVSREGVSRNKDFRNAYQEALGEAFKSIESLDYIQNEVIVNGTPDLNVQTEAKEEQAEERNVEVKEGRESAINNVTGKSAARNFTREGSQYFLLESPNGFKFFQKGMTEPFATLIRSTSGNNIIYNSITSKGMAHFDTEGNLIIEILKEDGNSVNTIIYRAEDQ